MVIFMWIYVTWEPPLSKEGGVQTMGKIDTIDKRVLSTQKEHFSFNKLSHYNTNNTL